jgi:hypothetical protein
VWLNGALELDHRPAPSGVSTSIGQISSLFMGVSTAGKTTWQATWDDTWALFARDGQ